MKPDKIYTVSAVIPTFNRSAIIHETLELIFRQKRKLDEILIIVDGSTDNTLSELTRYGDKIRVISIKNSGDLVARNTGLYAAKSDLVAFCDDDDYWQDDFISSMINFWELYNKPIFAYSDFNEVIDGKWSIRSKFDRAPSGYWSKLEVIEGEYAQFTSPVIQELIQFQPFFTSCLMVDRQRFLALGGWDEGVSRMVGCDFATALHIAEHPPIGVLRRPVVGIRKHAGNFSGDVQRMNLGDADVLNYVLSTRPTLAAYASEIRQSIEARRLAAFDTAFARGDFTAIEHISSLLSNRPQNLRHRLKHVIAHLPPFVRDVVWRIAVRAPPND